ETDRRADANRHEALDEAIAQLAKMRHQALPEVAQRCKLGRQLRLWRDCSKRFVAHKDARERRNEQRCGDQEHQQADGEEELGVRHQAASSRATVALAAACATLVVIAARVQWSRATATIVTGLANCLGCQGAHGYSGWSGVLSAAGDTPGDSSSCRACLNSRILLPKALPSPFRRLAPKSTTMIARMIRSSGSPMSPIVHLLALCR